MMTKKIRRNIYITPETDEKITALLKNKNSFYGEAIDLTFEELSLDDLSNGKLIRDETSGATQLLEEMQKKIESIRHASNGSDRNTFIIIELLNTLISHHNIPNLKPTNNYETKTQAVKDAEAQLKQKISNYKQRKDDKVAREHKNSTVHTEPEIKKETTFISTPFGNK